MLVFFAKWFAIFAHGSIGHKRKYTGEPYNVHLAEVAEIVQSVGGNKYQIAAAWLHDTVEDTWVESWMIRALFGWVVGELVHGLTDISKPNDGNRKVRKEMDRIHYWTQSPEVKTIKIADNISNLSSVAYHDPRFAVTYFKEAAALLPGLKEGDTGLFIKMQEIINQYNIDVVRKKEFKETFYSTGIFPL